MNTISQKSYAKINLNLNVIGKIKNLHKLQSIVSLISLYDEISLRQIGSRNPVSYTHLTLPTSDLV